MVSEKDEGQVYDLIGIGFGPSNLALAIALRECSEAQDSGLRYAFVERQPSFAWHSSLLLPGSQLQVSPLKDLATMRDPTSSYTFFNYLHQQGRLVAYINRGVSIPSRQEWSAYLTWAAKRLDEVVTYNESVVSVEPERRSPTSSSVQLLRVTMRNNDTQEIRFMLTRNITVGIGGVPNLPPAICDLYRSQRQGSPSPLVHSSSYLPGLKLIRPMLREKEKMLAAASSRAGSGNHSSGASSRLQLAVIGGGQSAAEMSMHLRKTFPHAHVKLIFRASALAPSDDSAFINAAAFDPDRTDSFWSGSDADRRMWRTEFGRTNYSVVRSDVLNEIYNDLYTQQLDLEAPALYGEDEDDISLSTGTLTLEANRQINTAELNDNGQVVLSLTNTTQGEGPAEHTDTFDAVFLGTGFQRRPKALGLLQPLGPYFPLLDEQSELHKADLGFADEAESKETIASLTESGDAFAVERLRHRVRGITRDYRLVSYLSDAFALHPATASSSRRSSSNSNSSGGSGSQSPSRESDAATASSHTSDDSTLAGSQGGHGDGGSGSEEDAAAVFEPSIYFLGGNEETHGLADSLFSIVAHRAGELCQSITKRHSTHVMMSTTTDEARKSRAYSKENAATGLLSATPSPYQKTSVPSPFAMVKEKMQRLQV